ncbi:MAG: ABC transporter substrate-binding protein [Ktedonobacteraceae bacterium]
MHTHTLPSRLCALLLLTLISLLAACGQASGPQASGQSTQQAIPTTPVLDAYGTPITFPKTAPQRIVTLVPSMSEVLGALKLQSKVVGVDSYTNYPPDLAAVKKVSDSNGTVNIEQIVALKPDLILSSGGITKNYDAQLTKLNLHVVDLPPGNFEQTLQQILLVGRLTYTQDSAQTLVQQLQQQVEQIKAAVQGTTATKVLLEVDYSTPGKPYVFGGGSFGDQILQYANASNIFHDNNTNSGYPQVTDESVIAANPQYVILTEDPLYGGKPDAVYKRANWSTIEAVKAHHVYHINTDIIQRPGPRLVEGLRCVAQFVHPDKFSGALPDYCSATV